MIWGFFGLAWVEINLVISKLIFSYDLEFLNKDQVSRLPARFFSACFIAKTRASYQCPQELACKL